MSTLIYVVINWGLKVTKCSARTCTFSLERAIYFCVQGDHVRCSILFYCVQVIRIVHGWAVVWSCDVVVVGVDQSECRSNHVTTSCCAWAEAADGIKEVSKWKAAHRPNFAAVVSEREEDGSSSERDGGSQSTSRICWIDLCYHRRWVRCQVATVLDMDCLFTCHELNQYVSTNARCARGMLTPVGMRAWPLWMDTALTTTTKRIPNTVCRSLSCPCIHSLGCTMCWLLSC